MYSDHSAFSYKNRDEYFKEVVKKLYTICSGTVYKVIENGTDYIAVDIKFNEVE